MFNYDELLKTAPAQEQNSQNLSNEEYAAMKRAERDDIFTLSDDIAMEVSSDSSKFQDYLNVQSKFDRYSAVNALLILAQNPDATRLGNFDYWKDKGGYIKPDEKSISILEPQEYTKKDGTPGVGYNIRKVFDISQINQRKMKPEPKPPNFDRETLFSALIKKAPSLITPVDSIPSTVPDNMRNEFGGASDPQTGEIYIQRGMEFRDAFAAVAVELAYAETVNDISDVAEPRFTAHCAAYLLCEKYGVDTKNFSFDDAPGTFENTPDLDSSKDNSRPQTIKYELSKIRNAAEGVASRVERQLDAAQQQKTVKEQEAR